MVPASSAPCCNPARARSRHDLGAVLVAAGFRRRVDLGEQIVFDRDGDPLHRKIPS
jgi:hypothetical protein